MGAITFPNVMIVSISWIVFDSKRLGSRHAKWSSRDHICPVTISARNANSPNWSNKMSITKPGKIEIAFVLMASRITRRSRYQKFIEEIGLKGGENVLDFGAGWGDNSYYIAKSLNQKGRVTALDVSEEWQTVAKKRLKEFHNIDFVQSDIRSSSLLNGSFDVIVISYVLHDIPAKERSEIIKSLAIKLKSTGFIQLREPTKERHGMPMDEIRSLMKKAGLKESNSTVGKKEFKARYSKS